MTDHKVKMMVPVTIVVKGAEDHNAARVQAIAEVRYALNLSVSDTHRILTVSTEEMER